MWPIRYCPICGEWKDLCVKSLAEDINLVVCNGCGTAGPERPTEKEAVAVWNQRPQEWQFSYEHEPRAPDGHEIRCSECANGRPGSTELFRPIHCPIWQINVEEHWHCSHCKVR